MCYPIRLLLIKGTSTIARVQGSFQGSSKEIEHIQCSQSSEYGSIEKKTIQ